MGGGEGSRRTESRRGDFRRFNYKFLEENGEKSFHFFFDKEDFLVVFFSDI